MHTYLLEIGCEEIPARFMPGLLEALKEKWTQALADAHLDYTSVQSLGTYRRLAVIIDGLAPSSKAVTTTIKGPPLSIAKDAHGHLTPAGLGFLKKAGVSSEAVFEKTEGTATYLWATKTQAGQPTDTLLPDIALHVASNLHLPIAMKWGANQGPFIRPVHWIMSLLDASIIPLTLFGINASRTSMGHRFLSKGTFDITHANTYIASLSSHFVLSGEACEKKIRDFLSSNQAPFEEELKAIFSLIPEVAYLTEWPSFLVGKIDKKYLDLPQEALVECMHTHQKFFPRYDAKGNLTGKFVIVADNVTDDNKTTILEGNQNVLKARLEDVSFFWQEDCRTSLASKTEKLKTVLFQKGAGSLYDKVIRIATLSEQLAIALNLSKEDKKTIQDIAMLCKTDLVTQMVGEFPKLQGIMGRLYAKQDGLPEDVSQGISAHYHLANAAIPGLLVGLADRIDTLTTCFCYNLIPTGSHDPWGIRQALWEIISLLKNQFLSSLSLKTILDAGYARHKTPTNQELCYQFVEQRIKTSLMEKTSYPDDPSVSYDIAEAVLPHAWTCFLEASNTARKLETFRQENTKGFQGLTQLGVRVARLAKDRTVQPIDPSLFCHQEERDAYETYLSLGPTPNLDSLAALIDPMNRYFEAVLVMDTDSKIRENRLSFIHAVHCRLSSIADFEKISV